MLVVLLTFFKDIQADITAGKFPLSFLVVLGVMAILIWHRMKLRRFEIWDLQVSNTQFENAALATAKYLDWRLINRRTNCLVAIKSVPWQRIGFRFTAIRTKDKLYVNSMVDPSMASYSLSLGWNKKNKKVFKILLLKAMNGADVVGLIDKKINEAKNKQSEKK